MRRAAALLDRVLVVAALASPLFLTHGRGLAEAAIDVAGFGLPLRSVLARDWDWLRRPWVTVAVLWWLWLCICSMPFGPFGTGGWPGLLQAVAVARFPLFAACLQTVALRDGRARRAMRWLIAVCCLYIAAQTLLQAVLGHNLFGMPRFHDGTLTGPYDKPRAAAPLSRLLLPVSLVASAWILHRPGGGRPVRPGAAVGAQVVLAGAALAAPDVRAGRVGRTLLAVLPPLSGLALMVLAGQRMPLLLFGLGLLVSGLLLRPLRPALLAALLAAPLLVAASALVSPHAFGHLVLLFEQQMRHFWQSPYGLIFNRALSMALGNPLTGLGFDGFRNGCADPDYFHAWPPWSDAVAGDGGGAAICVQHAHNHLLQALTDAGVPGLLLFVAMVLSWLCSLGRGLLRPDRALPPTLLAWRVGVFAAVFVQEWPIASASAFTNLPLGGWFFLLLGVGLADAYIGRRQPPPRSVPSHA